MVYVDQNICIGCQMCTSICPEVFEMDKKDKSFVKPEKTWGVVDQGEINKAVDSCPVECIHHK